MCKKKMSAADILYDLWKYSYKIDSLPMEQNNIN